MIRRMQLRAEMNSWVALVSGVVVVRWIHAVSCPIAYILIR